MDIKKTKNSAPGGKPKEIKVEEIKKQHKYWIGGYVLCAVASIVVYFLLRAHEFGLPGSTVVVLKKVALGAFFSFVALVVGRVIEMLITRGSDASPQRYNLIRIIRLITGVVIFIITITFLFQNWYTAAVSLGIFSLILGFALQVPISSFIAWLYIIFRSPYRVGDRIEITPFTGDVVEISYLDTTLWEFGGEYLSNDMPSGRLIRFPNSLVLQSPVFNYSWPKFPYIWNEIPFQIAYNSDLLYVESTLREATKAELDPKMAERIQDLKDLVEETAVDELLIKEYPFITFRISSNTWVEATVTYLVHPKRAAGTRTRIIKHAIASLLANPDRVKFPKGDSR